MVPNVVQILVVWILLNYPRVASLTVLETVNVLTLESTRGLGTIDGGVGVLMDTPVLWDMLVMPHSKKKFFGEKDHIKPQHIRSYSTI